MGGLPAGPVRRGRLRGHALQLPWLLVAAIRGVPPVQTVRLLSCARVRHQICAKGLTSSRTQRSLRCPRNSCPWSMAGVSASAGAPTDQLSSDCQTLNPLVTVSFLGKQLDCGASVVLMAGYKAALLGNHTMCALPLIVFVPWSTWEAPRKLLHYLRNFHFVQMSPVSTQSVFIGMECMRKGTGAERELLTTFRSLHCKPSHVIDSFKCRLSPYERVAHATQF